MNTALFETLAIKNGQILNKKYHNWRFIKGQQFLNCSTIITDIANIMSIDDNFNNKFIRCRITYDKHNYHVAYFTHQPRSIRSFKLISCDNIDYHYKYDNRSMINDLFAQKQTCDEIIIVKHNYVTDCSIGNLLFLKNRQWFTPDTPLLAGTQRQFLLDMNKIKLASIQQDDLMAYQKVMMINALNGFDESRAVGITHIY